jgi:hypothetical protein
MFASTQNYPTSNNGCFPHQTDHRPTFQYDTVHYKSVMRDWNGSGQAGTGQNGAESGTNGSGWNGHGWGGGLR